MATPLLLTSAERAATGALLGATAAVAAAALILYPLTWRHAVIAAVGAAIGVLTYRRFPWLAWGALGATAALWLVVAFTPLAAALTHGLVRRDPLPARADAVMVLSGSVTADGLLGGEALDRLLTALALLRDGRADTLIVTEPHPRANRAITAAADQRRLMALLPRSPYVLAVDGVTSTRTEAVGASRLAPPSAVRTLVLVTSPLHTRRAGAVFERVGYHVICVPSQSRDIALHTLATARDRIAAFRTAVYERVAYLVYRRRGWV